MKVRFISNIRAEAVRIYRKLFSMFSARFFRTTVSLPVSSDYSGKSFIGVANVLEVFVPYLSLAVKDRNSRLFQTDMLEPRLFQELGFWLDELKTVHSADHFSFHLTESLPQNGWDDVTGMKGRVVSVEIWGVLHAAAEINSRISDMVVNLGEAYDSSPVAYGKKTLKRIDQVEKLEQSTRDNIRKLMSERSRKIGDVLIRRDL